MSKTILVLGPQSAYIATEIMSRLNVQTISIGDIPVLPIQKTFKGSFVVDLIPTPAISLFDICKVEKSWVNVSPKNRSYDAPGKSAHKKGKR
jgi:hypothetical protein